ncbi:MAG: GNAT family N-acetyltransferase [Chloroflexota bacterium]
MLARNKFSVYIRPLAIQDLPDVVRVHMQAFPDSALTKLGREAVRRYYEWQITGPHEALNIGVYDQDNLLGFCFSGVFRGALGGFLEKNRAFLVRRVISHPWLLVNPLFRERARFAISRLYKQLLPRRASVAAKPAVTKTKKAPSFGILSIAVAPPYQGSGVAQLLMEYSEQVAIERGFTCMDLTVHPSNMRAVRFYEKMGWQHDVKDGQWNGHMSKAIGLVSGPEAHASAMREDHG